jgi:DNA-binding NarL/FixJ family response regulator
MREIDDRWVTVLVLTEIGHLLVEQNRAEKAARILAAADRHRSEIGLELEPHELEAYNRAVEQAHAELGDQAFQTAWSLGHAMSLREVADHALSRELDLATGKSPGLEHEGLTPREQEVATLVAQGLTNRQIASELTIAERTVTTHVAKILKKLRLESRAQLAAWVAQQQAHLR